MKIKLSNLSIILVVIACFIIDLNFKNWEKQERVIEHDVHNYYAYLPAQFIYNDIKIEKSDYQYGDDLYWFWPSLTPDGKRVFKMTMGLSVLYSPFFFVAHGYALLSDYPANGFSEPYKIFLLLSAIFYLLIGLDFLRKILLHYGFTDKITAITILLIGLGTNLLAYSSQSAPVSHVYNFCLFAVFIFYTIKWHETQSIKNTIVVGLLIGLITLVRPSNVVIAIFFIFYETSSFRIFKEKIILYKKKIFFLFLMIFLSFLVWVPQFVYWKITTGNFLFYSYTDEGFFFSNPKIIDGLFSFRKGWLVYTPIMTFALIGIFLMKDTLKKLRFPVIFFFLANIYVIFSWWCWWYGGTYGQRSLIESYALLAIPFASFVKFMFEKKWYYNVLFYCTALFFIWLNIFQTYQFEYHSLHWDSMSKKLYFKQFGKLKPIDDFDKYLDWMDMGKATQGGKDKALSEKENFQNKSVVSEIKNYKNMQLKAANNKFLCADKTINDIIIANRDNAFQWETFSLIPIEGDKYAIRAYDNRFLCAELNKLNIITATRTSIGAWETFTMVKTDDNFVTFKAVNGMYLSVDEKTLQIFAKNNSIGKWEKFEMINK